ncbi:alpha-ketoacid dehydrogenase subunit alpha/beta [Armatimonas rosea]|uniref:2-oxoisovalerate dehydrogenase E1 component n=1 Tax=Armatimonas rosea TaxID=685828 RepID=A0A7W9SM63_ARMRO|nr:alpha-ketoacid dehydrogenase subunit alpha/beta [Armatimonas rosea]MBB6049196.1 2-oxoisovalerate dehydrogenase E1 component [Armatimonas rosea]
MDNDLFDLSTTDPDPRALLRLMFLSREGDRREGILLRQGKGWFQVSGTGHETLGVLAWGLRPDDYLFPYYRDRAVALGRGVTTAELASAYLAKAGSSSGGRQMPGHYSSRRLNIFSVATPTAAQCLPAAGAAWGFKLAGTDQVAVAMVGDAATRQGEFYEAVAFALQEKLPAVFVIEDNRYGISTPTDKFFPYRIGALGEKALVRVDARDPFVLLAAFRAAVARARAGEGPTVLWCELDRLCSHTSSDDQRLYRDAADLAIDAARDPLALLAQKLIAEGVLTPAEWEAEQAALVQEVDAAYRAAELEPDPVPEPLTHLFGPASVPVASPYRPSEPTTMVAAVNETLKQALRESEKVLLFGEDIEDPKGGVFGLTKGLTTAFPTQVFNAPLAEATILGTAVGLAATGFKPLFEIQFTDFLPPAFNQLLTNVANLRWRTCGEWSCPMVILAPYGAYLPGGSIWHSESNEGIWAHVHGLNVVVPSTPEDAAGLLWSAIHSNDPTLFLLPKHIFRKRALISAQAEPIPLGKAVVRKPGRDITLVTFGNCIEVAEEAIEQSGLSVELIDLRSVMPLDMQTIVASLGRTGRLVVVHEDARTTGIGQAIITEVTANPEHFQLLYSAPQLVARLDTYIGYNPVLEYAALPSVAQVVAALQQVME